MGTLKAVSAVQWLLGNPCDRALVATEPALPFSDAAQTVRLRVRRASDCRCEGGWEDPPGSHGLPF